MRQKTIVTAALAMIATSALLACGGDKLQVTSGTIIQNATIVNTRDGSLLAGMSVIIDNGKITNITGSPLEVSGSAQVVDGSGKYVVPGYNDMHSHAMGYANQAPTLWPLLIANGVTGIREMAGTPDLIKAARQLNLDSAAGKADAPEILMTTGPILVGINSPAAAIKAVQESKAMGADFVKLFQASKESTVTVFEEAKRQGLTVAGHLPGAAVSATELSKYGMRALEHYGAGYGAALDCASDENAIRQALASGQGAPTPYNPAIATYRVGDAPFYQRIIDTYSESKCVALAQTFVQNETWMVPTLIRLHTIADSGAALYRNDPNLQYVDQGRRTVWAAYGKASNSDIPVAAQTSFLKFFPLQQKMTKLFKQQGVKMMTGSEVTATLIIPGFSLQQEFQELAAAGLTPLEVLQMTTLNPAQFLQREAAMGTVDTGKNADLVLLDANPVLDTANLSKIAGVFLKGRFIPKSALEKLKADVAGAYAQKPTAAQAAFVDPSHSH